jgi:hypothetical protein
MANRRWYGQTYYEIQVTEFTFRLKRGENNKQILPLNPKNTNFDPQNNGLQSMICRLIV